jgi:hypothetical protein
LEEYEMAEMKVGDKITVSGKRFNNRDWRWWAFWRPRYSDEPAQFVILEKLSPSEQED